MRNAPRQGALSGPAIGVTGSLLAPRGSACGRSPGCAIGMLELGEIVGAFIPRYVIVYRPGPSVSPEPVERRIQFVPAVRPGALSVAVNVGF